MYLGLFSVFKKSLSILITGKDVMKTSWEDKDNAKLLDSTSLKCLYYEYYSQAGPT